MDEEVLFAAVKQNGLALYYTNAESKKNKNLVLVAARQNGNALQYASTELKKDKEVVLTAVQQNGESLQYVSAELKKDREVVLAAVLQNGEALEYANPELKKDKEVVLAAIFQDKEALRYASASLKNDKEVVLAAVNHDWRALCYASAELKNDKDVVLTAVRQDERAVLFSGFSSNTYPWIQFAIKIYHNQPVDITNLSIQTLLEDWYPHLHNHVNSPVFKKIISIFADPKLQDFDKRQLLKPLFDLIVSLKNEVILSDSAASILEAIFRLEHPSTRRILVDEFNKLSLKQLDEISSQVSKEMGSRTRFELRTKVLLARLNRVIDKSVFSLDLAKVIYLNFMKDTKMQVALFSYLELVINLYTQLNENQKNKLILQLESDLSKPLTQELINKFKLLISMHAIFEKNVMVEVCDKQLGDIQTYFSRAFTQLFQGKSITQDGELSSQVSVRYQETFAKFREPMAIFTYLQSIKQVEPEVQEALFEYVYHVLRGDFDQFRNRQLEDQPHLAKLYQKEGVKELWLTQPLSIDLTDSGVVKSFNMVEFFYQKIVTDNHFQDEDTSQPIVLKEYLKQATKKVTVDHQSYLRRLQEGRANLALSTPFNKVLLARNQLEVLIIQLCAKEIDEKTFRKERKLLYSDGSVTSNEVEKALSNDFELLFQQLSAASVGARYKLQFTTDPNDLLLIGTEVQGSCQNIYGTSNLNKCLLGYMINGESQAIVITDSANRIVGRGILRLLSDDSGEPVLFLERLYLNKQLDSWKEAIISMAINKAKAMGVPLLSKEVGTGEVFDGALHFKGGRAPFIYSDASGGVLNGQQEFITTKTHILFNVI